MDDKKLEEIINKAISKEVLPLFNEIIVKFYSLEGKVDSLEYKVDSLENKVDEFYAEFKDFKDKQMSFNDYFIKELETLRIEYTAICSQLKEYDNMFTEPSIPEAEKQSLFKQMVIKVSEFEKRLKMLEHIKGVKA